MHLTFRSLLDAVETTCDAEALRRTFSEFTYAIGFRHFAYLNLYGTGTHYLGNFPQGWKDNYFSRGLVSIDPVVTQAKRHSGIFAWSTTDWFKLSDQRVRTFARDAMSLGLSHGLTASVKASFDQQLILSFAGTNPVFPRPLKPDNYEAVALLMGLHYRLQHQLEDEADRNHVKLSPRELICLTWAAKGKTANETAIITGLSPRTVQHYLDTAREKLDARTLSHLVAISKDIRLI